MILLDIEKGYDTVWIHGLLFKLIIFKLSMYLLFIIKAFLEGRTFTVHLMKRSPTPKLLQQAYHKERLSTTLITLYISDIPQAPPPTLN